MPTQNSTAVASRIRSLDGVKGYLSLKIALNHVTMFYTMVPLLALITGLGRTVSFPVLLFAFGVGNGISRRKKPVWPLLVLVLALIVGSILAESFLHVKAAHGFHSGERPMQATFFMEMFWLLSLKRGAHFTDFLQPYIFFLGAALVADRLKSPMREWKPWLLTALSLSLAMAGMLLLRLPYHGPLSQLWEGGYRTFQYAPLFAAGLLIGAHKKEWLNAALKPRWAAAISMLSKIIAVKFVSDAVELARPHLGAHGSLWKEGDPASVMGGIVIGLLLFSAYSDACHLFHGKILAALEKVGKRTIISLCVQMVVLPLVGMLAVQFQDVYVRAAIGLLGWCLFAAIVFNWDWLSAKMRSETGDQAVPHSPQPSQLLGAQE